MLTFCVGESEPPMAPESAMPAPDPDSSGDLGQLFERLYEHLRAMARRRMADERLGHPLQPTALVHEAYVRLVTSGAEITSRAHFLRLAAVTMRHILVDEARKWKKREGAFPHITLHDDAGLIFPRVDMIDYDRAINKLQELHERQAMAIELRFFVGLTVEEVAAELGVSARTIKTDTQIGSAWLRRELSNLTGKADSDPADTR